MAHTNTYLIYELLECVKGPVRQILTYRISMTQGNNRISERSPSEVPALTGKQKPETSYQTKKLLNEHLQAKKYGQKETHTHTHSETH